MVYKIWHRNKFSFSFAFFLFLLISLFFLFYIFTSFFDSFYFFFYLVFSILLFLLFLFFLFLLFLFFLFLLVFPILLFFGLCFSFSFILFNLKKSFNIKKNLYDLKSNIILFINFLGFI